MAIHLAARFGHLKVVEALIDDGCDAHVVGVYGKTAAHCLVERNSVLDGSESLPFDAPRIGDL